MIKVKTREKYRGSSRQELLDNVYELGFNYEKYSQGCSQSTVAALHELIEIDDVLVRIATSSAGGQAGQIVGTCGGLIGGTIVLDYFFGRSAENMSCRECLQANIKPLMGAIDTASILYYRYVKEYGTIICPHIQVRLFGRHYYILDPDELEKFEAAGAHSSPDKCSSVVGNAAQWVVEILLDRNVIEL